MSTAAVMQDPFAAYGGQATSASSDPFAAYGGKATVAPTEPAQPGTLEPHHDWTDILRGAGAGIKQLVTHPIDSLSQMPSISATPPPVIYGAPQAQQQAVDAQNKTVADNAESLQQQAQAAKDHPAFAAGQIAGPLILAHGLSRLAPMIPDAASSAASTVGDAAQDAGTRLMNNTVGTLKADFKRGANPARGYFATDNGPALSMQAIAAKASDALDATGEALGTAYKSATAKGVLIPVETVAKQLAGPIQKAIDLETGPGGTGNTEPIQSYVQQFGPAFEKASAQGGFTPSELFDIKRSISQNTNWSDPTQFSLKAVRQQQAGALSGILSDAVPETAQLNQNFQDLTKLTNRATERANTGSRPLTAHIYKAGMTGAGALAGALDGHALAGAAAGAVLDSVPFKTTLATGLVRGGQALSGFGDRLAAPGGSVIPEEISSNALSNYGENNKYSNPQGAPPLQLANGSTALPAPPSQPTLPQSTSGYTPTPPSPPPPFNPATARMRVQPTQFNPQPTPAPSSGPIPVTPEGQAVTGAMQRYTSPAAATPPAATVPALRGQALWASKGAAKLTQQLQQAPIAGVSAADLDALAKTMQGKKLLVIASDLTPGSPAMRNLVQQIKSNLGAKR